jgi:hypothetical protein
MSDLTERESKPSIFSSALYGLDEVLEHLVSLKEKIEGVGSSQCGDAAKPLPHTLAGLLEEGPGMVASRCSKAHEVIGEIESLLF